MRGLNRSQIGPNHDPKPPPGRAFAGGRPPRALSRHMSSLARVGSVGCEKFGIRSRRPDFVKTGTALNPSTDKKIAFLASSPSGFPAPLGHHSTIVRPNYPGGPSAITQTHAGNVTISPRAASKLAFRINCPKTAHHSKWIEWRAKIVEWGFLDLTPSTQPALRGPSRFPLWAGEPTFDLPAPRKGLRSIRADGGECQNLKYRKGALGCQGRLSTRQNDRFERGFPPSSN